MRGLCRCSSCVGLLALAMLEKLTPAAGQDEPEYEVHWVRKSSNVIQHGKRNDVCQLDGWSLCPASVGGGCCPEYFECGTASCYATTAGPTSCHGHVGYYNCPLTVGPGTCCPVGFLCSDSEACVPPPGISVSQSCPSDWFGCPFSLGGGCCRSGWTCGSGVCYSGTPMTLPVSETKTITDSRGRTKTTVVASMAVITDGPNTFSGSPSVAEVPQLILSTVAKVDAIQTSDGGKGGGGLSSGALGGIITGVVVIFVTVVVATSFIVLRLKKAERAAKDAEKAAEFRQDSASQPRSQKSGFGQPTVSEIDSTTDVDPLNRFPIMVPSPRMGSQSAASVAADRSPSRTPNFSNSGASSPPLWSKAFNYASSVVSDGRQPSLDSCPHHDNGAVRMSQRESIDSQPPYSHARQASDTSELEGPHGTSEIYTVGDSEGESQRRSNSTTRHARRNNDVSGQNRARGDSNAGAGPLGTVNEIPDLHGYHGPPQTAAGQTAVSLYRGPSSATSHQDNN